MSSPTPTPPPADPGFDPLVFWIQHRTKIVLLGGLLIVGLTTFAISEIVRTRSNAASRDLFAKATTVEDFRKVVTEYPSTAAGANAHLLLAEKLREEGKFDDSAKVLQTFIEKYPTHELISGAYTSLAANLEAQGKVDDALSTYQKVSTSYANSFSVPAALLAQARILTGKEKTEEARRIYEQVMTQFPDNPAAQQAAQDLRRLKK
jgi:tol-pal system protein YbgF